MTKSRQRALELSVGIYSMPQNAAAATPDSVIKLADTFYQFLIKDEERNSVTKKEKPDE